jgi:hypothetical protein
MIKLSRLRLPSAMRGGAARIRKSVERVLFTRTNLAEINQVR